MGTINKLHVSTRTFAGTADTIQILPFNPDRSYLAFYAKTGAPVITIGNGVEIPLTAGQLWEPLVAFTNSISHSGAGTDLAVMTSGEPEATYPLGYMTYALNYDSHTLTYTGV